MASLSWTVQLSKPDGTSTQTITSLVRRVSIRRGRRSELGQLEAGTAFVEWLNKDGDFDPFDVAGTYYAHLVPGARIVVKQTTTVPTTRTLFTGRIDSIQPSYDPSGYATIRVECVDPMAELTGVDLNDWTPVSETTGARITSMFARTELDQFIWSTALDTGYTSCGPFTVDAGTDVLNYLQRIVRSEMGVVFADVAGTLTFRSRWTTEALNLMEFRNTGAAVGPKVTVPYTAFTARSSLHDLANRVLSQTETDATLGTGALFINDDLASQANYARVVTFDMTDLICDTDGQADDLGDLLLIRYGTFRFRPTTVTVRNSALSAEVWDACLDAEVGDLARFVFLGASGVTYDDDFRIESIMHTGTPETHDITFGLSPSVITVAGLFTLDTSALDGAAVLAR